MRPWFLLYMALSPGFQHNRPVDVFALPSVMSTPSSYAASASGLGLSRKFTRGATSVSRRDVVWHQMTFFAECCYIFTYGHPCGQWRFK